MNAVSPLDHHPDHRHQYCDHCGDLSTDPTRCPGWLGHRTLVRFHAEGWENGEWTNTVSTHDTLADTVVQYEHKRRRFPDMPMRLMAALTVYLPVAEPADPDEQMRQILDGSAADTAAFLGRALGQERDRALAAEARVRELEAQLPAARDWRAASHRRATEEIRAVARGLYADTGIRVLAALDDPPPAGDGPRCVCGDPIQLLDDADPNSWIHRPGSDTRCLHARPVEPFLERLKALVPDDEPSEYTEYSVVGGWGVDGASSMEDARANVRRSLAAYPHCGARARKRTVLTWDDDTQLYGPWEDLDPEGDI
ncbi:hypothetical protein [Streptomyces scabiei]|uniref:hypothetical protein n=1 Tax=Streptomyces scabiei TaxID=1930 RepID=UPI0029B26FD5|nr:hypothetical protein [Streptomyces scabiei]MDX3122769.1 hypothetical protein [Streptomyces scabiei]MDX3199368.1 hypothetical protein [Streptomyces scabiei]MDX3223192.1 hypothetical protein [Streptomyces scabiei]